MELNEILSKVDHTLLAQTATWAEIKAICDDGMKYHTASVCIPASYVKQARDYVGDKLPICTVIGFPNGYDTTKAKCLEALDAVQNGADEVDMVINIGWVKDQRWNDLLEEIKAVKQHCEGKLLKVIIETCLLTDDEKIKMCEIVSDSGADYIKTSTGFSTGGATFHDVELFAKHVKPGVKIKAAGGISSLEDADILLYVTDTVEKKSKNEDLISKVKKLNIPILVLINKIDLSNEKEVTKLVEYWHEQIPQAEIVPLSAKARFNVDNVQKRIVELLPESPDYFDKDQLTDKPSRFIVSEIIREKILLYYDKEIPYSVEVLVTEFKEDKKLIRIAATIFVERESQKGIIIGHGGVALKRVGEEARRDIQKFFDKKVFLQLYVKVNPNWRNSSKSLESFGYEPK